jgi:hypothetical protein
VKVHIIVLLVVVVGFVFERGGGEERIQSMMSCLINFQ